MFRMKLITVSPEYLFITTLIGTILIMLIEIIKLRLKNKRLMKSLMDKCMFSAYSVRNTFTGVPHLRSSRRFAFIDYDPSYTTSRYLIKKRKYYGDKAASEE